MLDGKWKRVTGVRPTWKRELGNPRYMTIWVEKVSRGKFYAERGCVFIGASRTLTGAKRLAERAAVKYLKHTRRGDPLERRERP